MDLELGSGGVHSLGQQRPICDRHMHPQVISDYLKKELSLERMQCMSVLDPSAGSRTMITQLPKADLVPAKPCKDISLQHQSSHDHLSRD